MHAQIISILTIRAHKLLEDKPGFDLRNLLGGTDRYLQNLSLNLNRGFSFLLNSIHCLHLASSTRNLIGHILQNEKEGNDLFYALMIAKGQLVHLVRPKKHILYPPDLHLLINFVNSSQSFRDSDATLTPICLPVFNNSGFLHLYVSYLTPDICLLLLSSKPEDFHAMAKTKDRIEAALKEVPSGGVTPLQQLRACLNQTLYTIETVDIPDLLHFLYKAHHISQMTAPVVGPPFNTPKQHKRLFRIYEQVHNSVHLLDSDKPHKIYFHRSESETILAWVTSAFDLYACFSPLVSKPNAIRACNLLLRWIKAEENNLFILNSPVW